MVAKFLRAPDMLDENIFVNSAQISVKSNRNGVVTTDSQALLISLSPITNLPQESPYGCVQSITPQSCPRSSATTPSLPSSLWLSYDCARPKRTKSKKTHKVNKRERNRWNTTLQIPDFHCSVCPRVFTRSRVLTSTEQANVEYRERGRNHAADDD